MSHHTGRHTSLGLENRRADGLWEVKRDISGSTRTDLAMFGSLPRRDNNMMHAWLFCVSVCDSRGQGTLFMRSARGPHTLECLLPCTTFLHFSRTLNATTWISTLTARRPHGAVVKYARDDVFMSHDMTGPAGSSKGKAIMKDKQLKRDTRSPLNHLYNPRLDLYI